MAPQAVKCLASTCWKRKPSSVVDASRRTSVSTSDVALSHLCVKHRLVRETLLTSTHLGNMLTATHAGSRRLFSADRPAITDDIINHTIGQVRHLFDLDSALSIAVAHRPRRSWPT